MRDVPAGVSDAQIILHNDDDTPFEFVVDLIQSVFGRSEAEAFAIAATIQQQDKVVSGPCPAAVAAAMSDDLVRQETASNLAIIKAADIHQ